MGIALIVAVSMREKTQGATIAPAVRPGGSKLVERAKEKLNLSTKQTTEIKAAVAADKTTLVSLVSRLRTARVGLRDAIWAPDSTETSVRSAAAQVAVIEADMAAERFALHSKIAPILTPTQRQKIQELQSKLDELIDQTLAKWGERAPKP